MTTQIDGNHGTPLPVEDTRTEGGRATEGLQTPTPQVTANRVEVSNDAEFVNQAVRAANESPEIRQDKVEQARKALADGTLGDDATTVADAIIDQMLDDNT
jgi:flagellar biosynthesis anti-sigma factor FlgM